MRSTTEDAGKAARPQPLGQVEKEGRDALLGVHAAQEQHDAVVVTISGS
jgi:hypothetical protein